MAKSLATKFPPDHPLDEPSVVFPCFSVDENQMPEIKSWVVGEDYTLKVKVTMRSASEMSDHSPLHASFDVKEYEVVGPDSAGKGERTLD